MKEKYIRLFIAIKILQQSVKELKEAWISLTENEILSPELVDLKLPREIEGEILDWTKAQIECIKSLR